MNRNELIEKIALQADISKGKASLALEALIRSVTEALVKGEEVSLVGFGTFTTSMRAERMGRNPATGQEVKIAACRVPKFRAGSKLKEAVAQRK